MFWISLADFSPPLYYIYYILWFYGVLLDELEVAFDAFNIFEGGFEDEVVVVTHGGAHFLEGV